MSLSDGKRRVALVAGGAFGIGAAIALELAQQGMVVVVMDPGVSKFGESLNEPAAEAMVERIEAEGGIGKASTVSVTDADGVRELIDQVVKQYGSLDVVVNPAGFSRITGIVEGTEEDWAGVIDCHLNGYLNVLSAALPIMIEQGYGRVVGFTSGAGWRASGLGAYGCAKRAIASLTWQLGRVLPAGVTVNALSPIAKGRAHAALSPEERAKLATGGLDLEKMPSPEAMGPFTSYLASEISGWCTSQVLFCCGSEVTVVAPPRLIEVVRSDNVSDFGKALAELIPQILGPAESLQRSSGGSNGRVGPIFDQLPIETTGVVAESPPNGTCIVISDDDAFIRSIGNARAMREMTTIGVGPGQTIEPTTNLNAIGFAEATEFLNRAAKVTGEIDSIVVGPGIHHWREPGDGAWEHLLRSHAATHRQVLSHVAWLRAAGSYSMSSSRPIRVVHASEATSPGQLSSAQAIAQLVRGVNVPEIDAFSVSMESTEEADSAALADLIAHLVTAHEVKSMKSAELLVRPGWVGLRSHPAPQASITYGGPSIPDWFDDVLREIVNPN